MDITTLAAARKMIETQIGNVDTDINNIETLITTLSETVNGFIFPSRICAIPKSSNATLVYPNGSQHLLVTMGAGSNQYGIFTVYCSSNNLIICDIAKGNGVTYTKDGLELTINNGNTGNGMQVCDITFYGGVPTEKVVNDG